MSELDVLVIGKRCWEILTLDCQYLGGICVCEGSDLSNVGDICEVTIKVVANGWEGGHCD